MPQFLSEAWVDAFNQCMDGVRLPPAGEEAGLVAQTGHFVVAEEVRDVRGGDVVLLLEVDDGRLRLSLARAGTGDDDAIGAGPATDSAARPDVTIVLGYEDAAAMATGELSPSEALTAGRVRVRGDLAVLVTGQQLLAEARRHTGSLADDTTY